MSATVNRLKMLLYKFKRIQHNPILNGYQKVLAVKTTYFEIVLNIYIGLYSTCILPATKRFFRCAFFIYLNNVTVERFEILQMINDEQPVIFNLRHRVAKHVQYNQICQTLFFVNFKVLFMKEF